MKTLNYVKFILFFTVVLIFSSCGDDITYTNNYLKSIDKRLCSKEWVDEYITDDDKLRQHILLFREDGKGNEKTFTWTRRPDGNWNSDPSSTNDPFTWRWVDNDKERLYLDYYGEKSCYFNDIIVREHYLSGKLNDENVTFMDPAYLK